mmetsp:Transcript_114607/g.208504  ORF Transcript_114607/g.208504 Transcript_114607/m.208504 type:complete len:202 (+) Transcript_114607:28-633(+)
MPNCAACHRRPPQPWRDAASQFGSHFCRGTQVAFESTQDLQLVIELSGLVFCGDAFQNLVDSRDFLLDVVLALLLDLFHNRHIHLSLAVIFEFLPNYFLGCFNLSLAVALQHKFCGDLVELRDGADCGIVDAVLAQPHCNLVSLDAALVFQWLYFTSFVEVVDREFSLLVAPPLKNEVMVLLFAIIGAWHLAYEKIRDDVS